MRIGRRAKGFFFTLLVVVLFFLVLLSTRAYTKQSQASGGLEATKAREDSLRGAVESIEADAARVAGFGANRSVYYAGYYVAYNRTPLGNASARIAEIFMNGSLNGSQCYLNGSGTCCFQNQTQNAYISLWNASMTRALARNGFNASLRSASAAAAQAGLFEVRIALNGIIFVNDSGGVAWYERATSAVGVVDITGFEDPSYALFNATHHRYLVPWNGSSEWDTLASLLTPTGADDGRRWVYGSVVNLNHTCNCSLLPTGNTGAVLVVDEIGPCMAGCNASVNAYGGVLFNTNSNGTVPSPCWERFAYAIAQNTNLTNGTKVLVDNNGSRHVVVDVEKLRAAVTNQTYYRSSTNGPDYFGRLMNNFSLPSPYGLESFVNYSMVSNGTGRSWIDYYYLNSTNCSALATGCFRIKGSPNCENSTVCDYTNVTHFLIDNESVFRSGTYTTHLQYYGLGELSMPQ